MGHSFGGFLTQLLVQRDVAAAAVAIDSVPPAGVPPVQLSALRSLLPVFNPLKPRTEPYLMSFKEFQYAFVHTLPLEEQRRAYDKEVVPESRVLASGALSPLGRVDFQRDRAPLLFIAGEVDHIMPARLNRRTTSGTATRPRSRSSRCSPDARTTSSRSRDGKRSPTSRSSGRCVKPEHSRCRTSRPESENAPALGSLRRARSLHGLWFFRRCGRLLRLRSRRLRWVQGHGAWARAWFPERTKRAAAPASLPARPAAWLSAALPRWPCGTPPCVAPPR